MLQHLLYKALFELSESRVEFVRSYFNNFGYRHPAQRARHFSVTLLDSMASLVSAYQTDDVRSYYDLIARSS